MALFNSKQTIKYTLLLLSATLLGCEYLPHSAKLDLSKKDIQELANEAPLATTAITKAFEQYDVVAIGDYHWNEGTLRYAIELIKSGSLPLTVKNIVVEFGNAKYQYTLDDYINGEDVSQNSLQEVMRGSLYFMAWMPEIYREFFTVVRTHNMASARHNRIKVHLAEAPFDWEKLTEVSEWETAAKTKTAHFYKVSSELLDKEQKALLIFGAFHLIKATSEYTSATTEKNWPLATRLKKHYPNKIFTIWPLTDPVVVNALDPLDKNSLVFTKNTPIKELRMIDILPKSRYKLAEMGDMNAEVGLLFDAFLYVGKTERITLFPRSVMNDEVWVGEMQRRVDLIGGRVKDKFDDIRKQSAKAYELNHL